MKKLLLILFSFVAYFGGVHEGYGQCANIGGQGSGISPGAGCAPHDENFTAFFNVTNLTAGLVEFQMDWGDGSPIETFDLGDPEMTSTVVSAAVTRFDLNVTHTYGSGALCLYEPTANLVLDGVVCTEAQTQNAVVWDTDNNNGGVVDLIPDEYEVCAGSEVTVTFTDATLFNCVPPAYIDSNPNFFERKYAFQYGTMTTIADIEIDGTVETYPFYDNTVFTHNNGTIANSGQVTSNIFVPATAAVGQQFEVTLYYWNICNPFNGNDLAPNFGDAEQATALITIVPPPDPQPQVFDPAENHATDAGNNAFWYDKTDPVQTFCADETVFFRQGPTGAPGGNIAWDFDWDGNPATFTNDAGGNTTNTSFDAATYAGTTVQVGMRITRGDVGTPCIFYDTLTINIAAGPIADFDITPNESCESITFSTTNNSTNADGYTWSISQVFGPAGTIEDISTQNNNTALTDVTITGPGRYRVSLTATSTTAVSCPNTTTRDILIYDNPVADFTATEVCEGDLTTFTNLSNIPTTINGDAIRTWEFVFDFDPTDFATDPEGTFDAQTITTLQASDFTPGYDTLYTVAGEYKVALRVTTRGDRGACVSAVDTTTVTVKANPVATFDFDATYATANGIDYSQPICPGVPIALINNSPAGQTNPVVDRYYVFFESQDGANDLIFPPSPGDFGGPGTVQIVDPGDPLSPLPNPFSAATYTYDIYFIALGDNNCESRVGPLEITLLPEDNAGFNIFDGDPDVAGTQPYDPDFFYCSPQEFFFETDATTKAFNADEYIWTITDGGTGDTLLFPFSVVPDGSLANERINFNFINEFPNVNVKQFNIDLEVISNNFCISSANRSVRVFPEPSADFDLTNVIAICDSVTFRFEAIQSSLDYNWSVTASDPTKISSTLENENFFIVNLDRPLNGETDLDFTVELFTTNLVGCVSETVTFDSTVFEAEDIQVDIDFIPNNATSCLPAEFDLQNTTDPATIPAGTTWKFEISKDEGLGYVVIETIEGSDQVTGNEDFSTAIPYEFTSPGQYRVDLLATAVSNCVFGLGTPKEIEILETPNVNFNLDVNQGCGPLDITIIDNSTSTQDFDIFYSVYNPFDNTTTNGTVETGMSGPLDGVVIPGLDNTSGDTINYEISLIASNALGCADTLTRVVAVYPRPQIDFEIVSDNPACEENYEFEFGIIQNDVPPGTRYLWTFGTLGGIDTDSPDNQFKTFINPNNTAGPVDYIITLIARTPAGCTDTATQVITLNPVVRAGFFRTVSQGCTALDVNIIGNAQGTGLSGNYKYEKRLQGTTTWFDFDATPNPNGDVVETFENTTASDEIYEIRQIVFSDIGNGAICYDTSAIQQVTVFPLPETPVINGPSQVCVLENNVNFSVPHTAGNTYTWILPSFAFISSSANFNSEITVNFGALPPEANPAVKVLVRSPSPRFCVSDTATLFVDVVEGPTGSLALAGPGTICPGESTFLELILDGPGSGNFDVIIYDGFVDSTLFNVQNGDLFEARPNRSSNYRIREVIDLDFDRCPGSVAFNDIRVNVNIAPIATLSGDALICEGQSTNLRFNMSGIAPWTVTYSDGADSITVNSNSSVLLVPVSPVANTVYSLVDVSDASCTGVVDTVQATVEVNPAPGGSIFLQEDDGEVCINTPIGLGFVLEGEGPWTVRYQDDEGNIFAISDIEEGSDHDVNGFTIHLFEVIPQKEITDYTIIDIVDANGCPGPGDGTARVTTLPVPVVRMTDNSTICEGESANLVFNFPGASVDNNGPFDVFVAVNDVDDTLKLFGIPDGHIEPVSPTQTTNYRVVTVIDSTGVLFSVKDNNGCQAYDLGLPVRVRVRTRPTVVLEGQDSICFGEETPLTFNSTGVGPWTITYTDGTDNFTFTTPFNRHFEDVSPLVSKQYTVVSVTDANVPSCSNTGSGMAEITVAPELQANFTASPENMTLPDRTVTINNTTTNKDAWTYVWDFGDSTTSTAVDPEPHVYDTYGTYFLRMTATNGECTDIAQTIITIEAIPAIVDFVGDPIEGCLPLTVNFENLTQFAEDSSYLWSFGDNQSARVISPIHTYTRPGVYTVKLSANNITGVAQEEEKVQYIRVFDTPQSNFSVRSGFEQVFTGDRVEFSNSSVSADQFLWDFGDGNESTEFEPVHVYADSGIYSVQLIAINSTTGCTDTLRKNNQVLVVGSGEVRVANAFTPSRGGPGSGRPEAQYNDFFLPLARGVSQYDLKIYNRWGELLFESDDSQEGWDGYYKGELMPMGVYVYRLELVYENGRREVKLGDVTLIR